jgi:phosphomannomutase/phosphoglucomutase
MCWPKSGRRIIFDVKCTRNLATWIERHGGASPLCGKRAIPSPKAKLKETNALLAGEMSGRYILSKERWYGFDDGLYAGALLELLSKSLDIDATLHVPA